MKISFEIEDDKRDTGNKLASQQIEDMVINSICDGFQVEPKLIRNLKIEED